MKQEVKLPNGRNSAGSPFLRNHYQWFIKLIEILLVLLLIQQWFAIGRFFFAERQSFVIPEKINHQFLHLSEKNKSESEKADIQHLELTSLHLFGEFKSSGQAASLSLSLPIEKIPVSRLRATVTGLLAHTDANQSMAVIENRGQQKAYKVNDRIEHSNATVAAVYRDRVIINHRGRQEALLLQPKKQRAAATRR